MWATHRFKDLYEKLVGSDADSETKVSADDKAQWDEITDGSSQSP